MRLLGRNSHALVLALNRFVGIWDEKVNTSIIIIIIIIIGVQPHKTQQKNSII